ncbi:MAG: hypothetical protein AABY83_06115 [Pseudomonadota bacterium]
MKYYIAALCWCLSACNDEPALYIAPQIWQDFQIRLETRPPMPTVGMNEILVIATRTGQRKLPVWDALISLRADDNDEWRQAIQDGHTGVYRRAVMVHDPATQDVQVQLQRGDEKVVLRFPLRVLR